MYAEYGYYISNWGGVLIPATEYTALALKSERYLQYVTSNKIVEVTDLVKNAVCAAAEALYEIKVNTVNLAPGIKSQSCDGVSVTYESFSPSRQREQEERMMYRAIRKELYGTNLLYRGQ